MTEHVDATTGRAGVTPSARRRRWVALVAAGTGCVTFGAVLAVLVGIGLGFYLATLV